MNFDEFLKSLSVDELAFTKDVKQCLNQNDIEMDSHDVELLKCFLTVSQTHLIRILESYSHWLSDRG